jgi:hypothetical protein
MALDAVQNVSVRTPVGVAGLASAAGGAKAAAATATSTTADLPKFGLLLVEVVGLACVVKRYQLESEAFFQITALAAIGFAIQYFLPLAVRSGFFLCLSLASILLVLGFDAGTWLIALGLGLIVIVHLPISMTARILLVLVAGGLLAALRAGWEAVPWSGAVWPILGSMFMFRLIVYMYDLKHGQAPALWSQRLSYFFMFPNVCFPLFPVVDSRAYVRSWFEGDRHEIHQVGVEWILRGAVQLILYRLIYLRLGIDPYDVANFTDFAHYCLWLFLLYLRVSGQFHVIVGLLHLFGFNLTETHHQYYLASSFTDFWRRINIYWKDFMMKVFYYPTYFRLRGLGPTRALVVSTIYVFAWTWVLHAYQLFWIRGSYTFTWNDPLFWTILAVLVAINALWEMKFGRRRALVGESQSWRSRVGLLLKTLGTFVVICLLWSFWSSESVGFWLSLLPAATVLPSRDQAVTATIAAAVVAIGIAVFLAWERWATPLVNRRFAWRAGWVLGQLFLLNAISISAVYQRMGPAGELVSHVRFGGLNKNELELLERGYYEDLLTVDRFNGELAALYMKRPPEWERSILELGLTEPAEGLRYTLKPNVEAEFKGAMLRTNRWGMHDQDYAEQKPAGAFRIAFLGASHAMGTGVAAEQTMEAVLEERLNQEQRTAAFKQCEVLNCAVYGYNPIEQIRVLEDRVRSLAPDAIMYVGHPGDSARVVHYLATQISRQAKLPDPFLEEVARRAKVTSETPERLVHRRLAAHGEEVLAWVYERIARICADHGVRPIFVLLPMAMGKSGNEPVPREVELAGEAGFTVLNLQGVYDREDEHSLWIAEWDAHPNALGHRLIGERIFALMRDARPAIVPGL